MLLPSIPGMASRHLGRPEGTGRTRSSFLVSIVRDPLAPIPAAEHAGEQKPRCATRARELEQAPHRRYGPSAVDNTLHKGPRGRPAG